MVGILARLKVQKYRAIALSRNYSAKYFSSQQPESPRPTINQEVQAVPSSVVLVVVVVVVVHRHKHSDCFWQNRVKRAGAVSQ